MPVAVPAASTSATASLTSTTIAASGVNSMMRLPAERLKRAMGIKMSIAWRIMLTALLGRQCPEPLPADVLFSNIEFQVLEVHCKLQNLQYKSLP
jgi:hypothetical protein